MYILKCALLLIVYFFSLLQTVNCSPIDLSQLLFPAIQKPLIHWNCLPIHKKSLRLCFIFPCYQNKHTANLLHQRGPILTCLSEGLLIFHNWFACFHPVLGDKYLQLSHKSNIYEKHTCHWKNTGRVSRSVIPADWCEDFSRCLWRKSLFGFFAMLVSRFLLLWHDNGDWK